MKSCLHCKYAEWNRTTAGRLHSSGDGQCKYPYKLPPLPASMFWIGTYHPVPSSGHISRNEELRDHCAYFVHDR